MRVLVWIAVLSCACLGCKAEANDHDEPSKSGNKTSGSGGSANSDEMSSGGMSQGGGGDHAPAGSGGAESSDPQTGTGSGGSHMMSQGSGGDGSGGDSSSGAHDAGAAEQPDAAIIPDGGALMPGMGSCCMEHDTPGCSNADLEVCVCEKLTECCSDAWSAGYVLIVQQKYCQPGVRDCVCGSEDGQWNQPDCCLSDWSDTFCDEVAISHCGAEPGCL